jgi:hypothetical protein
MHQALSADDVPAVRFGYALMTEANAENRNLLTEAQNDFLTDTSFAWRAGAWRNADVLWSYRCDFINRDFIVAFDQNIAAKLAEILREVVGERIVVVD